MSEPTRSQPGRQYSFTCPYCRQSLATRDQELPAQVRCFACHGIFSPAGHATLSFHEETPPPEAVPALPATDIAFPELPGYEILEVIGQGGMGIVYKARDKRLQRLVAIKMIRASASGQPADLLARFRREAEAVAHLKHPNIVQIFTIEESPKGPFFVMELVPGGSLSSRIKGVPQEAKLAARLVQSLAGAVQAAHEQGILHRDLKPGNVLLVTGEVVEDTAHHSPLISHQPKITDFGLAKDLDNELDQTMTAGVVGTPSYMAPEQAARGAKKVGPAADIYALGAILYEMLTGQPPFRGTSLLDTLDQVRTQEPVPVSRLQPRTPFDLEVICLKCLEKEPHQRYASAASLAEDLARFLEGKPILARPAGQLEKGWKWARRQPARAALVAVSALAVLGLFAAVVWDNVRNQQYLGRLKEENDKTEQARKEAVDNAATAKMREKEAEERRLEADRQRRQAVEKTIRLTLTTGQRLQNERDWLTAMLYYAEAAALGDPDSPQARKHQLRLAACLQQCPKLVQLRFHRGPVSHVEFSSDGNRAVSTSADGTARIWETATGSDLFSQPLTHQGPINHAAFSADARRVLTGGEDNTARLWDVATGQALGAPLKHKAPVIQVAFSPAGNGRLLTVAGNRYVVGTYGSSAPMFREQRIVTGVGPGGVPRSTTIMVPAGSSGPIPYNPRGLAQLWDDPASEKPVQTFGHIGWINHAEFRPDGLVLATANCSLDKTNGVRIWPVEGNGTLSVPAIKPPLLRHALPVLHVAFSPDGRRLVAASGKHESNLGEAKIWDIASGEPVGVVMKHQGMVIQARFSPNGKTVLTASADGTARLWDAETGNPVTDPLRHRDRLSGAWFSPDGRRLLTAGYDGMVRLWDARTGEPIGTALKHGSTVTAVAFHPHSPLLLSGCQDGTVRLWDLATAAFGQAFLKTREILPPPQVIMSTAHAGSKTLRTQKTLPGRIATSVIFSPDGRSMLAGSGARYVDLLPGGGQAQVLSGFRTMDLCVWDAESGRLRFPPLRHPFPIRRGWVGPQGHFAVLNQATDDSPKSKTPAGVEILEISGGKALHQLRLPANEEVKDLRFLPGGEAYLLTLKKAGTDKVAAEIRAYHIQAGRLVMPPLAVDGTFEHACVSGDGQRVAILARAIVPGKKILEWSIRTWNLKDPPQPAGPVVTLAQAVNEVVLNQEGSRAIVYHSGKSSGFQNPNLLPTVQESQAFCCEVATGKAVAMKHKGPIQFVCFGPEGQQIITCSEDHTARVWDAATGQPLTAPLEHRGSVHHADISSDGVVATAAADHACLWDLATGDMLSPPLAHHDRVIHVSFRPDGRCLASAGCDGIVRIWDLSLPSWPPAQWQKLVQVLSGHRIDSTQGVVALPLSDLAEAWNHLRAHQPELFRSSPRHVVAWHQDELEQALKEGDPRSALVHLEPLNKAAPERSEFWVLHGQALGQMGRLAQAEVCFVAAKKLDATLLDACYPLTLVLAALGKNEEARRNAEHLLQNFAASEKALQASSAIRAAVVSVPGPVTDLLALAEELATRKSPPSDAQATLGAAEFRAGKIDDAIQKLTVAAKATDNGEQAWAALFLSLAHHQKGNREEARKSWQTAIEAMKIPKAAERRRAALAWTFQLELDLLRREAARILGHSATGEKTGAQ